MKEQRVLVVDDSSTNNILISNILNKDEGFVILTAQSSKIAIDIINNMPTIEYKKPDNYMYDDDDYCFSHNDDDGYLYDDIEYSCPICDNIVFFDEKKCCFCGVEFIDWKNNINKPDMGS